MTTELINDMANRADERVCFSICDKMTQKGMSFNVAFDKTIKTLRKGINQDRSEKIKKMALDICKENCELFGVEFKM